MCIFCKIVQGEIPCHKVYEDKEVLAILDISQVTKGHTLVIPKKHYDHMLVCDSDTYHQVMDTAQKLGKHIMTKTEALGMNILSNVNEVAGQTVSHFHVHLIPRYGAKDAVSFTFHESAEQDLPAVAKQIKYQ